jgi:Tol biopolymer transport system component/DNA-binding winged helix-turn-helix (wHTH) protein
MSLKTKHFYEFGPFRVDATKRLLLRANEIIPLTPKTFDTLLVLLRHSGQVLEKDELMKRLWPDSFVEEANLTQNVSVLRKALGESPHDHRYIVTVPGRGYRFVADVRELWDEGADIIIQERTRSSILIEEESETQSASGQQAPPKEISLPSNGTQRVVEVSPPAAPVSVKAGVGHLISASPRHHRKVLILASAALLITALAFVTYRFAAHQSPARFEKVRLYRLTSSGRATCAAISADGKFVAYAITDSGQQSLWLRQVATGSNVQITPKAEVDYSGITFSRDGDYIYYVASGKNSPATLYQVPVLGGASTRLIEDVDTPVTLSPDGKRLAFVRGYPDQKEAALMLANADGTEEHRLATLKGNANFFLSGKKPAWSPDGQRIVAAAKNIDERGEYHYLFEVRLKDGTIRPIPSQRWQQIGQVEWMADGSGFIMTAADEESNPLQQVWHVSYPNGEARKITNDLNDYSDVSLAADSNTLVALQSDRQANIWVAPEANLGQTLPITSGNYDGINGLSWTPDNRIVYASRAGGNQNLWIMDQDGSHQNRLTTGAGDDRFPSVSPDQRYIVFVSDRTGTRHLWRIESDGSHPRQLTNGIDDADPSFSPDGQWVIYKSYAFITPNLLRVSIDGGESVRLTDRITAKPAVSPQGDLIACFYRDPALSPYQLALIPYDGGRPIKTLDIPFAAGPLRWTADGQALTYIETRGGVSNIWRQPISGGAPTQLTDFKSDRIFWFDWSRDGRWLALARGVVSNDVVMISNLK